MLVPSNIKSGFKMDDMVLQALGYQIRKYWRDLQHLTIKFGK